MPIAKLEEKEKKVAPPTKQEIAQLMDEIRELYPKSQYMRLEIGTKLLLLQSKLAHYGNGKFTDAIVELKIPRSTAYDLMGYAKQEAERLSDARTNSELDIDFNNEEEIAEILRIAYGGVLPKREKQPKKYLKKSQLHFFFKREDRKAIHAAWEILKPHKDVMKKLAAKVAKEIINAAAKVTTNTK